MKYQTKLVIQGLSAYLVCILLLSCSKKQNKIEFLIKGYIVDKNYEYNLDGFINTPYGRVNIKTQSYYKNGKLVNLDWNRANGFLPYSIEYLRSDPKLYKSFNIDSLFSKEKEKILEYKTKVIRNDTTFYKNEQEKIIITGN